MANNSNPSTNPISPFTPHPGVSGQGEEKGLLPSARKEQLPGSRPDQVSLSKLGGRTVNLLENPELSNAPSPHHTFANKLMELLQGPNQEEKWI